MTNIIYFPGFRSTGYNSEEIEKLRNLGNLHVFDYPSYDPLEIEKNINNLINSFEEPWNTVIYGPSYGGYWAIWAATKFNLPCIVLNPSLDIRNSGMSKASSKKITYVMSFDKSRFYRLCNKYIHDHDIIQFKDSLDISGFICLDDKIVKPELFINKMSKVNKEVHQFEDGGHSGQKHFQIILDKIKETILELS